MPTIFMEQAGVQAQLAQAMAQPTNQAGLLPYLNEQASTLADKIVVNSLDSVPKNILDYFWNVLGLDLIVNNFNNSDIALLEIQVFQTCLDKIGHIPIRRLRRHVEVNLPVLERQYENIALPDGTPACAESKSSIVYKKVVLENVYWDELINMLVTKATIMAKRSRDGFTTDKLTSFKNVQGYAFQPPQQDPGVRWI